MMDGTLQGPDEVFRLMEFYLPRVGGSRGQGGLVHCRRGEVDLETRDAVVAATGAGGSGPLSGVGRFLPRGRARLCLGGLEQVVAGVVAEAMGHAAAASFVARRTEGVHRRCRAALSGKARQGLGPRTGLLAAERSRRASGLRQGASGEDAHGQRLDGERRPPRGQLATERRGHLLARRPRRADALVAGVLQVEALASPDEQSLCNPADQCRITPTKPQCSRDGKGGWTKTQKPWPKEIDEWTHYLHGPDRNPVARDTVLGRSRRLQWQESPCTRSSTIFPRSHKEW